jgi:hypothetical protein
MEQSELGKKALAALTQAVGKVIDRHKKSGRPLVLWENGKVVYKDPKLVQSPAK